MSENVVNLWMTPNVCGDGDGWELVSLETEEEELFVVGLFDEGAIAIDKLYQQIIIDHDSL